MRAGKFTGPVAFATIALLSPASAGAFDGCGERSVTCYEKVRKDDVYATVARPVVVEPARREVIHEPAVVQNRPYRVPVAAPHWRAVHVPARTMTVMHRELVRPAQVRYVEKPAVYAKVTETVVRRPGHVVWRHSRGLFGRERLCAERAGAETATATRTVMVEPARRVAVETPAVYHVVPRQVQVAPARVRHVYDPGRSIVVTRPVVLKPAATVIVDHPPVVALQEDRIRVKRGGYEWQPAGSHRW